MQQRRILRFGKIKVSVDWKNTGESTQFLILFNSEVEVIIFLIKKKGTVDWKNTGESTQFLILFNSEVEVIIFFIKKRKNEKKKEKENKKKGKKKTICFS